MHDRPAETIAEEVWWTIIDHDDSRVTTEEAVEELDAEPAAVLRALSLLDAEDSLYCKSAYNTRVWALAD